MERDSLFWRLLVMAACGVAAYGLRHGSLELPMVYDGGIVGGLAVFALIEALWPDQRRSHPLRRIGELAVKLALVAVVLATAAYALKVAETYSRLWWAGWLVSTWVVQSTMLVSWRPAERRRLILVGEQDAVRRLQSLLPREGECVVLSPSDLFSWLEAQQGAGASLAGDEILVVGHPPDAADRTALVLALHGRAVAVRYCVDQSDLLDGGVQTAPQLLPPAHPATSLAKRAFDLAFSVPLLLAALPVMLVVAALIRCSGPGPLLFRQRRLGLGGHAFMVYKFRTMVADAADQADVPQARGMDDRITPIGAFLRRWALDELPQLVNVLRGEMSLVGPRPHALPHDMLWGSKLPLYAQRFRVRPGLTGSAQVDGRRGYAPTIDEIGHRLDLDLDYIRNWSLWLDLRIMVQTIPFMLREGTGDVSSPLVREPVPEEGEAADQSEASPPNRWANQ